MKNQKVKNPSKYRIWIVVPIIIVLGIIFAVFWLAPQTTSFQTTLTTDTEQLECLKNDADVCIVMPAVTGVDLNNQILEIPAAFSDGYTLIVMPFDRDEQVLAVTWLPLFQELAETYEDVSFFNIAALPDLNAAVRLLVISGMQAGMRDPEIRQQTAVVFLENQQAFLEALAIDDTEQIQIFIMDKSGVVFWRSAGVFDEGTASKLREALQSLH